MESCQRGLVEPFGAVGHEGGDKAGRAAEVRIGPVPVQVRMFVGVCLRHFLVRMHVAVVMAVVVLFLGHVGHDAVGREEDRGANER